MKHFIPNWLSITSVNTSPLQTGNSLTAILILLLYSSGYARTFPIKLYYGAKLKSVIRLQFGLITRIFTVSHDTQLNV